MSDCPQESYGLPNTPCFHCLNQALTGSVAQRDSTLLAPGTLGHVLRKPQGDRDPEKRFSHGDIQVCAEMNQATKLAESEKKAFSNATS